jgi:hypothetical protein
MLIYLLYIHEVSTLFDKPYLSHNILFNSHILTVEAHVTVFRAYAIFLIPNL